MRIVMPSPWKHPKTGIWWYRVRVPADVAAAAKGRKVAVPVGTNRREIILSDTAKVTLATRDPAEAKVRFVAVSEALSAFFESLRTGPITMSFRQRQAIAGSIMEGLIASYEEEPGDATQWRAMGDLLSRATTGDPETVLAGQELLVGSEVDDALAERNLDVTDDSRRALLHDATEAFGLFFRDIAAMADRDYSKNRFPVERDAALKASKAPTRRIAKGGHGLSFDSIIDERVRRKAAGKDAKGTNPRTIAKFRREADLFSKWRGSDDATTVTRTEVEGWMAHLQANGVAGKPIGNRTVGLYMVDLGTVTNWGMRQNPDAFSDKNPWKGIDLPDFETIPASERAFRLDEARAILTAARREENPGTRWLPFLACYTGGRISELQFLRRDDFRQVDGKWYFRIDDTDLRSIKTKSSRRTVPVHPALIAEGLMTFVLGSKAGTPLFKSGDNETIGRWIRREKLVGRTIAPNHAWRHLMTDLLTVIGASNRVRLAIVGRASGSSEDDYGGSDVALIGLWRELAKIEPIVPPPMPMEDR